MMKKKSCVLACDIGASGGKAIVGSFDGENATFETVHRFPNKSIIVRNSLYWDILRIYDEVKFGIIKAQQAYGCSVISMGIDTWANDFVLLDKQDTMLENPHSYRDGRTEGMVERAFEYFEPDFMYQRTGQQFARFSTLYHLLAMAEAKSPLFEIARDFLFVPDYLCYLLGAEKYNEYTLSTVSNLFNINTNQWDEDIISTLKIPRSIFQSIIYPGQKTGDLSADVCRELKISPMTIRAVGGHDTASAVLAAPADNDEEFLFISSGTWSLVGAELRKPCLDPLSMNNKFGNEGGVGSRTRFIRNVMGLWILQECLRIWQIEGKVYDFPILLNMADNAAPCNSLIDPDDERLFEPTDMPRMIRDICAETGQPVPEDDAQLVRVILESLANKYRFVVEKIQNIAGKDFPYIHIIGGGCKNTLLCQFTANCTKKTVIAGPSEATAIGNALAQWLGMGEIEDIKQARQISAKASDIRIYQPLNTDTWEEKYEHFKKLLL